MLVLTRKSDEALKLGSDITITVVEIKGNQVRLGIEAPPQMRIYRKELYDKIESDNIRSSAMSESEFARLKGLFKKHDKI